MSLSLLPRLLLSAVVLASSLAQADDKPAARTIVLLRHGHYVADSGDNSPGPGLSPLGIAQAHLAAARIAGLPFRFDAVYVSPLTRARDTAAVIVADLPGTKLDTEAEIEECTPPFRGAVKVDGTPDQQAACAAHLDHIFETHFKPAAGAVRRELFVCHGNVTRYLVAKALGIDTKAWPAMTFAHASFTTILIQPDGSIHVLGAGDNGHLPANLVTYSSSDPDRVAKVPAAAPAK